MSGRAPAVDSGGKCVLRFSNGGWDGVSNFGDSVLKFTTTGGTLALADYCYPE